MGTRLKPCPSSTVVPTVLRVKEGASPELDLKGRPVPQSGTQFANPGSHKCFEGRTLRKDAVRRSLLRKRQKRFLSRQLLADYWHAVPLTANEVGTALVVLFQVPLNPMPL